MITGTEVTGHEQASDGSSGAEAKAVKLADPSVVAKAKALLSQGLVGDDQIGNAGEDGMYKGKSMELGKGGRSLMMQDRITLELVNKGFGLEQAKAIAQKQTFAHGVKKYGAQQMEDWGKAASDKAKAAKATS